MGDKEKFGLIKNGLVMILKSFAAFIFGKYEDLSGLKKQAQGYGEFLDFIKSQFDANKYTKEQWDSIKDEIGKN